jgi:hypothetical protein
VFQIKRRVSLEKQVGKITVDRNEGGLQENLRRYCENVLALGATRATIVSVRDIPVDRRITLKCQVIPKGVLAGIVIVQ